MFGYFVGRDLKLLSKLKEILITIYYQKEK